MHEVNGVDVALKYLENGIKARSTASTGQNEASSRSHAVFRIHLRRVEFDITHVDLEASMNTSKQALVCKLN